MADWKAEVWKEYAKSLDQGTKPLCKKMRMETSEGAVLRALRSTNGQAMMGKCHHIEILEATRYNKYRVALNGEELLQERKIKGEMKLFPRWFGDPLPVIADGLIDAGVTEGFVYLWDSNPNRWRARLNIAKRIEIRERAAQKKLEG